MTEKPTSGSETWAGKLRGLQAQLDQPRDALIALLREVVAQGVAAVGSAEGSILVPDPDGRHLIFLVSHGPSADKLTGMRVPIESSIAGCVFTTNQMTAVGDLEEAKPSNFYAEISKQTGTATRAYLVVPILLGERSWGVATYVNRPGPPPYQPFQTDEMGRAHAVAVVEAVVLRYLEQTRQLALLAKRNFASAVTAHDPAAAQLPADPSNTEKGIESWAGALQDLTGLPEADQSLCAEFIAMVARRRSWGGK